MNKILKSSNSNLGWYNVPVGLYYQPLLYICGTIFFILSFFFGYILSFGLVRLRTIRLSARAGAHIKCSSRSCAEDVSIINVIIKTPDEKCDWGVNDVMLGIEGLGILVILEKNSWLRFEPGRGELIFEPGRGQSSSGLRDAQRVCLVWWNSQHSKNCFSLSPRVENPKSREGKKSFVPEIKEVVSVSGFLYASGYFGRISRIRIFV